MEKSHDQGTAFPSADRFDRDDCACAASVWTNRARPDLRVDAACEYVKAEARRCSVGRFRPVGACQSVSSSVRRLLWVESVDFAVTLAREYPIARATASGVKHEDESCRASSRRRPRSRLPRRHISQLTHFVFATSERAPAKSPPSPS